MRTKQEFEEMQKMCQNKIADLEAKLAESESENKQLIKALNGEIFINYKIPMENAQLKQQLAEKKKDIEVLKLDYDFVTKQYNELIEKGNYIINQDKISFAAQTLENLRNEINANGHYFKVDTEFYKYIEETIGTKIKRLKGGV